VPEKKLAVGKHENADNYLAITFISLRKESLYDFPTGILFMESPTISSREFSLMDCTMLLLTIYDLCTLTKRDEGNWLSMAFIVK